jgi:biopolymer transport protein ExbB/TolQ
MEAAVAEREVGMTEWNDGRLDDLCKRVERIEGKVDGQGKAMQKEFAKQGQAMQKEFARVDQKFTRIDGQFERVGERFDEVARGFGRVESELVRVNDRLDGFHRSMTWAAWVMVIGMLGLLGVLTGIVADKA